MGVLKDYWTLTLTAVLVVLKLMGFVHLSWWWVTCLVWGPLAFVFGLLFIVVVAAAVIEFEKLLRLR